MIDTNGRIMLPVAQNRTEARKPQRKPPLCWEEMSKQEQRLWVQAEQEIETNMVSAKIMEEARQRSQNEDQIARLYMQLRYQQLWRQSAAQQQKLAERETRRAKIVEWQESTEQSAQENQTSLGKGLLFAVITILAVAGVGAAAYAMVGFLTPQ